MRAVVLLSSVFLSSVLSMSAVAEAQVGIRFGVPGVRVHMAPPPVRVEVQPVRPSPGHHWIAGHWAWRGNQHVWIGGHWVMPPGAGYVWEPARWQQVNGQWEFVEGHWRMGAPPPSAYVYQPPAPVVQQTVIAQPPPAPVAETPPPAPYPGWVWVGGHWRWSGTNYVWVGGHWSGAPRPRATWVPAHYERRGPGWVMVPGHWQ